MQAELITIGDEPSLRSLPADAVNLLMENGNQESYSDRQLLEMAQEKFNVYHLLMMNGSAGYRSKNYWRDLMGENCIELNSNEEVATTVKRLVVENHSEGRTLITDDDGPVINFGV